MTLSPAGNTGIVPVKCILHGETPSDPEDHVCESPRDPQGARAFLPSPELIGAAAAIGLVFAIVMFLLRRRMRVAFAVGALPVVAVAGFLFAATGPIALAVIVAFGPVLILTYGLVALFAFFGLAMLFDRQRADDAGNAGRE
jgi:hypothetical protein